MSKKQRDRERENTTGAKRLSTPKWDKKKGGQPTKYDEDVKFPSADAGCLK